MAGLHVGSLKVSHFRSHLLTRLETDARPVALFGPNGAGKTNILEAVSLLSPGRGLRRAAASEMSRRPEGLGWKVTASIETPDTTHDVVTWSENGQPRQTRIDDKTAQQNALGRLARFLWLVPSMDRIWIEGAEGRRRFLDRVALSFQPDHGDAVVTYERAMRDRNRLLKDRVQDRAWYRALEAQMADAGAVIARNRQSATERLRDAQNGAETVFPAADLMLTGPDDDTVDHSASEALVAAFDASRGQDMRAGRTLIGPHRADLAAIYAAKATPARDCSTGEQKALLISLVLANARALKEDLSVAPVLLLDEVAAHLDESRRASLYDEICALGAQAWMTGTEPGLFDALGTRAQYLHVFDRDGTSVAEPAQP